MKVFLNNLKKLWKFTKGEKAKLILFGVTNTIGVLIGIILPIFSARIIIYLTDNKFKQLIMMAAIIYLIENIYNIVFYFQRYASQRIFRNVYISIQKELGREILKITNSCFDEEVFKSLVDYIIIGGYDNGKITEYMIRFICKTKFNFTVRNNLTTELILKNNDISIQENDFITILDFYSMQKYNVFEKDENNKITKVEKDRVRVRFEIEKQ